MRRLLFVCYLMGTGAVTTMAQQSTFYFPQIADGIQDANFRWRTTVFLTNPATSGSVSGSIVFTRSDGFPFGISFNDQSGKPVGDGNVLNFDIPPGQTRRYLSHAIMPLRTGFGTVTANGNVSGSAIFSLYRTSGQLVSEAGVPAANAALRHTIIVDRTLFGFEGQYDTGVAYANPGDTAADVTLQLFDSDGLAFSPPQVRSLRPKGHETLFVGANLFPTVPSFAGTMRMESDRPLAVLSLRADPSYLLYSTVPPIVLASWIRPAWNWLEQQSWLSVLRSLARAATHRSA